VKAIHTTHTHSLKSLLTAPTFPNDNSELGGTFQAATKATT